MPGESNIILVTKYLGLNSLIVTDTAEEIIEEFVLLTLLASILRVFFSTFCITQNILK